MRYTRPETRAVLFIVLLTGACVFLSGACGVNRPLKEATLVDEALRYGTSFERNMQLGRYQPALSDARKALTVNRILDRDDQIAVSLNNQGVVFWRLGMKPEATASFMEAAAISKIANADKTLAVSLNNLGQIVVETDAVKARLLALEAFEIGKSRSSSGIMARAVHIQARAAFLSGDDAQCRRLCEEALALAKDAGDRGVRAACLVTLGRLEASEGNNGTAVKLVGDALAIDRQRADPYAIAMDYWRLARIHEIAGDEKAADMSLEKAEEIFQILGIKAPE